MEIIIACVVLMVVLAVYKIAYIRGYNLGQRYSSFEIDGGMSWEEAVQASERSKAILVEVVE
jgi:Tfp pilus assembly protein PilX